MVYSSDFNFKAMSQDQTEKTEEVGAELEFFRCPICAGPVGTSEVQCSMGHKFCTKCKMNLSECPTCKEKCPIEECILQNGLKELMPNMCSNNKNDCGTIGTNEHYMYCEYRVIHCKVDDKCDWQGFIANITDHISTVHPEISFISPTSSFLYSHNFRIFDKDFKFKVWTAVYVHDNFFWKYTFADTENERLIVKFYHLPEGKPKHVFYGVQSFKNGNVIYTHSMKASTESTENELKTPDPHCMVVPFQELYRFFGSNSKLTYEFVVVKEALQPAM